MENSAKQRNSIYLIGACALGLYNLDLLNMIK